MKPEAINRACAELCGWINVGMWRQTNLDEEKMCGIPPGEKPHWQRPVPPFTTSLDAAQRVFMALKPEQKQAADYYLREFMSKSGIVHFMPVEPTQWCEAILRSAGLWREGE